MAIGMSASFGIARSARIREMAVHLRHFIVDQDEIEVGDARRRDGLQWIEEGGGARRAVRFDMPFQEVEDGAAVIDEERVSGHRLVSSLAPKREGRRNRAQP